MCRTTSQWREYDAEDTGRFYALQRIIEQGTDWRFLTALKKELKE